MIMNQLLHDLFSNIITVGEDVSGMPKFSRKAFITFHDMNQFFLISISSEICFAIEYVELILALDF